jgi:hypothetical protein
MQIDTHGRIAGLGCSVGGVGFLCISSFEMFFIDFPDVLSVQSQGIGQFTVPGECLNSKSEINCGDSAEHGDGTDRARLSQVLRQVGGLHKGGRVFR